MGYSRLAIYLVGLLLVVGAAWVFLTQTDIGQTVPAGAALAVILLLVGIGVMASAKNIRDTRETRRVVHDSGGRIDHDHVAHDRDVTYEERRYD